MSSDTIKTNRYNHVIYIAMLLTALIISLILSNSAVAGELHTDLNDTVSDSSEVFTVVEKMPEIEGGLKSVYDNIEYPTLAARNGVEGKVFVKFVVDENGNVSNPEILKDIGSGCGEAVIKGIKHVKFTPGEQNGRKVKVYYTLPVTFKLD